MNSLYVLSFVLALAVHAHGEGYNTANDGFDLKKAVESLDFLKNLNGCFLDGPCDPIGTAFKKDFPDAIATGCVKCNDQQKALTKVFMTALKSKDPSGYEALGKKYDPAGNLFPELEANVAKY